MVRPRYRDRFTPDQQDAIREFLEYALRYAEKSEAKCKAAYYATRQDFVKANWDYYRNIRGGFRWALAFFSGDKRHGRPVKQTVQDRVERHGQAGDSAAGERDNDDSGDVDGPRDPVGNDSAGLDVSSSGDPQLEQFRENFPGIPSQE